MLLLIALALIGITTIVIQELMKTCDNYFSTNYYVHENKLSWLDA